MKTYQKIGIALLAVLSFTACGSGQSSTPVTLGSSSTAATPTPTPTAYGNSYPINGGTETLTQVFQNVVQTYNGPIYYTTLNGTTTFTETATVAVGDKIIVEMTGAVEQTNGTFLDIFTTTTLSYLNDFKVHLYNTVMLETGSSMYGTYTAQAAGTATFSASWSGSTSGLHQIGIPIQSNVFIGHCIATDGSAMTCP